MVELPRTGRTDMDYHPDLVSRCSEESPNLQCVRRALGFFQENFLYFGLAFLFPVLFAYGIHAAAGALVRSALHGAVHADALPYAKLAAVAAIRWGGYGIAAMINGFVLGGITVAVRELRSGNQRPTFERALEQSRAHLATICGSALLQFFGFMFSVGVCFALAAFLIMRKGFSASVFLWVGYAAFALCLAVFTRWMLSISVIGDEHCGVFASFRRSQELTANFMPFMLLFVAPASIASYLAGKIPYYAFELIAGRFSLPAWSGWLPFVLSFVFVAWTEPLWAIGCAEAYYSARENSLRDNIKG